MILMIKRVPSAILMALIGFFYILALAFSYILFGSEGITMFEDIE